jgi:hypothetical protein
MAAACGGRYPTTWQGDIQLESNGNLPEQIFRFFNRVDEADGERLKKLGYNLPSLSVGDYFTVKFAMWPNATTYRVLGTDFDKVTNNAKYAMEAYI